MLGSWRLCAVLWQCETEGSMDEWMNGCAMNGSGLPCSVRNQSNCKWRHSEPWKVVALLIVWTT